MNGDVSAARRRLEPVAATLHGGVSDWSGCGLSRSSLSSGKLVLVAGGASFIGSHLAERLLASGFTVRIADDLSTGSIDNLQSVHGDVDLRVGDLRDVEFARSVCAGADVAVHLAAQHGGRGYIDTHPAECLGNMALDHRVFSAAAEAGIERVVFASSACVYPVRTSAEGEPERLSESMAGFSAPGLAYPDGEYGWAKLMGERQLEAFAGQYGFDATVCRLFSAYGERENETHAVIALIAKALARVDPFPIWGDGSQTRGFTYVGDTVEGLARAATLPGFNVVNVGHSQAVSVSELCAAIFDLVGWHPDEIAYEVDRPVGTVACVADSTRTRELLGWAPATPLVEGLARTVEHCRSAFDPDRLATLPERLFETRVGVSSTR